MSVVHLVSKDGSTFTVDSDVIKMSQRLRKFLIQNPSEASVEKRVPLPEIVSDVLKIVVEWCEKHKHDPSPRSQRDEDVWTLHPFGDAADSQDQDLRTLEHAMLHKVALAAETLEIEDLVEACCLDIAKRFGRLSVKQIRRLVT